MEDKDKVEKERLKSVIETYIHEDNGAGVRISISNAFGTVTQGYTAKTFLDMFYGDEKT